MAEAQTEQKQGNGQKSAQAPAKGEIVRKGDPGAEMAAMMKAMGMDASEAQGFEQVQSGGVSRWLNLKSFQDKPDAAQNQPVKGNGKFFAGLLLSRQEIEVGDDEAGELNADGHKVRFFYTLKLATECPVTIKDEDGQSREEIAKPGDIISVGERHALKAMREMAEDGGQYMVVIKPHSRIKIGRGQTMWTFDMFKKTIKPPMKVKAELVAAKAPF